MRTFRDFATEVLGPIDMLPVLDLPITAALGCRTAAEVHADLDVPGYRQALVQGYAVNAADLRRASATTPAILPVGATVAAGSAAKPLAPGCCAKIDAGAQLPPNTDAVVAATDCVVDEDKVTFNRPPVIGQGFRDIGTQFASGDLVVEKGEYLGHVSVAKLALMGRSRVLVHPNPRVVIVTIGSELLGISEAPREAAVHDATGVLLATTTQRLGADCYRVGPVRDDPRAVRDAIEDQLVRADIVVTAGGIDTSDDVLRRELVKAGLARFDGPVLRPCSAYGVGRIGPDETPIIALPGDPGVALLAFHALARPIITAMLGRDIHLLRGFVPPRVALTGSRLIPGRVNSDRFIAIGSEPPRLAELSQVTAIAIHHAGRETAEVVEWPF